MLEQVISTLAAWIVAVISAGGYFGVLILMAIESACIPLPSEIIMPFSGYLVSIGRFSLIGAATAGALGCNLGSTVAYYVAAKGGRAAFERWGRYVLISAAELDRAEHFFARYGAITVFELTTLLHHLTVDVLRASILRSEEVCRARRRRRPPARPSIRCN
jgi:membrane protein DedA with SNARE-associated domain